MALRDAVDYTKDGRGIRVSNAGARDGMLRYRIIALTAPSGSEQQQEYRPVKEVIDIKSCCVLELTDGRERLLIGPKRTEARLMPILSAEKGTFQLNADAPPFHLSRLWLQNDATGIRFFLGNVRLNPKLTWKIDGGGNQFHFGMDEYCKAYYEGI